MNFIVQEVVELEALEGLEHLLDVLLEHLDQHLILNLEHALQHSLILLHHPLLLFFENSVENLTVVVLCLDFLSFQIDNLPQKVHRVRPGENFPEYFTCCLLQLVFQVLNWHVGRETLLLHLLLDEDCILLNWLVLTLLFQDLGV